MYVQIGNAILVWFLKVELKLYAPIFKLWVQYNFKHIILFYVYSVYMSVKLIFWLGNNLIVVELLNNVK